MLRRPAVAGTGRGPRTPGPAGRQNFAPHLARARQLSNASWSARLLSHARYSRRRGKGWSSVKRTWPHLSSSFSRALALRCKLRLHGSQGVTEAGDHDAVNRCLAREGRHPPDIRRHLRRARALHLFRRQVIAPCCVKDFAATWSGTLPLIDSKTTARRGRI